MDERYSRQTVIPEIGPEGQAKLKILGWRIWRLHLTVDR